MTFAPDMQGAAPADTQSLRSSGDGTDDGQIMLLSIVYGLIALGLVLVVATVSHLHIERKRLWGVADALAAGAADAGDLDTWYRSGGADGLVLSDASVAEAVTTQLEAMPAAVTGSFADLTVIASSPDGERVDVTLSATARPPFVPWVLIPWRDGIVVEVTSQAHATEP
ncbi:MAG TPA: hypothetical protein VK063_08425 [Beutenbergiaceae bacterium]|nr:hypothetical protein [Beutenbergiaceae bacterium]